MRKNIAKAAILLTACVNGCSPVQPHRTPTTLPLRTDVGGELLVRDPAPPQYRPAKYAYVMPEEQQRRILREAPGLREGQTVAEVVAILGPPWSDEMDYGKDKSDRPSRNVDYFFARRELDSANSFDPGLFLFFSERGHLQNVATNVEGLPELNWPPDR